MFSDGDDSFVYAFSALVATFLADCEHTAHRSSVVEPPPRTSQCTYMYKPKVPPCKHYVLRDSNIPRESPPKMSLFRQGTGAVWDVSGPGLPVFADRMNCLKLVLVVRLKRCEGMPDEREGSDLGSRDQLQS